MDVGSGRKAKPVTTPWFLPCADGCNEVPTDGGRTRQLLESAVASRGGQHTSGTLRNRQAGGSY